MNQYIAEFIGTAILIIFGNGVVANVVLDKTKGNGAGWIVITLGWGMAVFIAVFCVAEFSGAHLNPAVTIALWGAGKFATNLVAGFIAAQMLGAMVGSIIVYCFYVQHFKLTEDGPTKLACFCTAPAVRSNASAFFCEMVGTFLLTLPVMLIVPASIVLKGTARPGTAELGLGALGALPVSLLIVGIGLSLGGTTGYAINPARDLGPRIAHAILPIPRKGSSDWSYAWIPVIAPIIGALLAAAAARSLAP